MVKYNQHAHPLFRSRLRVLLVTLAIAFLMGGVAIMRADDDSTLGEAATVGENATSPVASSTVLQDASLDVGDEKSEMAPAVNWKDSSGYYQALVDAADESRWRSLGVVERTLTPTSLEDLYWMQRHLYPKREDVERPDVNAMKKIIAEADFRRERDRVIYAANSLAAHYFTRNDPQWREFAGQSAGPFPEVLRAIDSARAFDQSAKDSAAASALLRAILTAQYMGEVDLVEMFRGFRGGVPSVPIADAAELQREIARSVQQANRFYAKWGLAPMLPSPRPSPPWLTSACDPNGRGC
jgi:hypothetical protein